MPEDFRLIVDLVLVLAAATAGGLLASLLRQPAILGYLIGGMIVGPAGLGLIKELVQVETLAQFGVAFLLFALGVEFSFAELKKVQGISLGGGGLQIALTVALTTLIAAFMGWETSPIQGVFLGAILSLSSTAVVLKCLMERNETNTPYGQVMLGILVVQDLALGLMLAVLPALDQPQGGAILEAVGRSLLLISLFALGAIIAGIWVIPRLLRFLAKTESRELFLLGVVALCLGIALLTEHLGFSIEMGAFVAGLMISEVEYADQTLTYVEPLRDIFAALFFVAVGMLIDPVFLWEHLEIILGLMLLVVVGKTLIVVPIVKLFGYSWRTSIITGVGLAQIGEFSFVLASAGQALGLVSRRVYLLIVGTTALTLIITPFVLQVTPKFLDWAETKFEAFGFDSASKPTEMAENLPKKNHIIVCGYGRVGRNLVRLLQSHDYPVVVIDQSEQAVQELRNEQIPYLYGNAASWHVLESAGVDQAKAMAIALPDAMSTRLCLKRALEFSPDLDTIVMAYRDKEIELLYQLGAKEVVQPEFEASLELSTHLLTGMGLPTPQIQKEMQQIRSSHYLDFRPEQLPNEVARDLKQVTQEMNSKWYVLPPTSPLMGISLAESNLRRLIGITVMAIRRSTGEEIDYPSGETRLEPDDKLLVVGEPTALLMLDQLAKGEVTIPAESTSCQWIRIPENSPIVGKTLSKLDLQTRLGVQVQALRREDKFYRWPSENQDLQPGDRLLLCGGFHDLNQARLEIIPKGELTLNV